MIEVGRAQRTVFVARYLRDRDLQREIDEGLNVVGSWDRANNVIFFGAGGDIATNRRDEQDCRCCACGSAGRSGLRQHLDGADVLADGDWAVALIDAGRRGRTPLFWAHVAPYGEIKLHMSSRLALAPAPA